MRKEITLKLIIIWFITMITLTLTSCQDKEHELIETLQHDFGKTMIVDSSNNAKNIRFYVNSFDDVEFVNQKIKRVLGCYQRTNYQAQAMNGKLIDSYYYETEKMKVLENVITDSIETKVIIYINYKR